MLLKDQPTNQSQVFLADGCSSPSVRPCSFTQVSAEICTRLLLEGAAAVSEEAKAAKRGFLALGQNKGATDIGSVFIY